MGIYYMMAGFLCLGSILWDDENPIISHKRKKAQNLFLILSAALFIAVATLRYGIGFDYFNYENMYKDLGPLSWKELLQDHVGKKFLGYSMFMRLCFLFHLNYRTLLLLVNTGLTIIVFKFIKKYSPMPWLSAYLYLTLQFFAHSMNLMRQSIAATICLLSYDYLKKRKFLPFAMIILLASSFHLSAVFWLPFYWILNWKVSGKRFAVMSAALLPVYLYSTQAAQFLTKYIFRSYAGYIGSRYWRPLGMQYIIFPAIYFAAVWLCRKRLLAEDEDNRFLINTSFYVLILYVFSTHHMILERFSIYLFFYALILLPKLAETFRTGSRWNLQPEHKQEKETNETLFLIVLCAVVVLGFAYLIFASKQGKYGFHKVYPYHWVFNK